MNWKQEEHSLFHKSNPMLSHKKKANRATSAKSTQTANQTTDNTETKQETHQTQNSTTKT